MPDNNVPLSRRWLARRETRKRVPLVGDLVTEPYLGQSLDYASHNKAAVRFNNSLRAYWAACALRQFTDLVYGSNCTVEPLHQAVQDFLANLYHFCDAYGLDLHEMLDYARETHYEAEIQGD